MFVNYTHVPTNFAERRMTLSLVIRVKKQSKSGSIWGRYTGKTDLKLDSLSFLTLITKFQSNSTFCIL